MKTLAQNYIDYHGTNYAIRVWRDSCHPMRRDNDKWISFDQLYTLPLPSSAFESIELVAVLRDYEQSAADQSGEDKHELRRLLRGEITFAIAFVRPIRSHTAAQ